jgi:probable HAF family extracellular repeat protein
VAGSSETAANISNAFITGPNGAGMTDLGALGGANSFATGINDAGQVVGYSDTAAVLRHAFVTGPNGVGMTDLNLLMSLPGVSGTEATAINNLGQAVVVTGLVPEPETYALLLAGLGLIGVTARRRKAA